MAASGYTKSKAGGSRLSRARQTRDRTLGTGRSSGSRRSLNQARQMRDRTLNRRSRRFGVIRGGGRGGPSSRGRLRGV